MTDDDLFIFRATLHRVVDGDTVELDVDLGFSVHRIETDLRILGLDTPELRGEEKEAGLRSKAALEALLAEGSLVVQTRKAPPSADSFGRYLAQIWVHRPDGTSFDVAEAMISGGYGVPYVGR